MKKQVLVIGVIVLFIGVGFNPAIAYFAPEKDIEEVNINLEYSTIGLDTSIKNQKIKLSESEFLDLQNMLLELIEKLDSVNEPDDFEEIITSILSNDRIFGFKHPIIEWILNFLSSYKLPRSRSLVISQGWGFKINPFRNHRFDIYRPLTIWQYSDNWGFNIPGRTFILKLSPFNTEILHDRQIGCMTHFFGLYIFVSQPIPQKCWTFFVGSARRVIGIDFDPSPSL
jgi:hypothetical protein